MFISSKSNLWKNKTSLVHVRLLSGIGSRSSGIFEHKNVHTIHFLLVFNPFAPGDFAEKHVLKLVEWFSGHCRAIKS